MKKLFIYILIFSFVSSCKTKSAEQNPDTLPKDVSLKPDNKHEQQQKDQEQLANLFEAIQSQIDSVECINEADWRISPIGAKPCGGPATYIAYPIIFEDEILPKIQNFSGMQRSFNEKYGLMSDCAMVPAPSGLRCENGEVVLLESSAVLAE